MLSWVWCCREGVLRYLNMDRKTETQLIKLSGEFFFPTFYHGCPWCSSCTWIFYFRSLICHNVLLQLRLKIFSSYYSKCYLFFYSLSRCSFYFLTHSLTFLSYPGVKNVSLSYNPDQHSIIRNFTRKPCTFALHLIWKFNLNLFSFHRYKNFYLFVVKINAALLKLTTLFKQSTASDNWDGRLSWEMGG